MMKKTYALENLDCANCAAKMETAIQKIGGVRSATVNFMTQKLSIEAEQADWDSIIREVKKCIRRVEPDCELIVK